ncbi:DUF6538 domain-containing protein [Pacificispira sp.]|uniref:DUF6538 domain-containing protein n=1 Tax=Pacificispira sp. TaxID=2888761 RepID=UPI003B523B54
MPTNRLLNRKGTWYFRAKVPAELVEAFGQREAKKSLRTSDKRVARKRADVLSVQFDAKIDDLRRKLAASASQRVNLRQLSRFQINRMVSTWVEKQIAEIEGSPIPEDIEEYVKDAQIGLGELERYDPNARASILDQATRLLAENDITLKKRDLSPIRAEHSPQPFEIPETDRESEQFQVLCKAVRRAFVHVLEAGIKDAKGHTIRPDFGSIFGVVAEGNSPSAKLGNDPNAVTLAELKERFDKSPRRKKAKAQKAKDKHELSWLIAKELFGEDQVVSALTRADFRAYFELVSALPPRPQTSYPGMTFQEAAEAARNDHAARLAPATVNAYMDAFGRMMRFAKNEGFIETVNLRELSLPVSVEDQVREPFTVGELNAIFAAPLYTGCVDDFNGYAKPGPNRPRGHRFWVPLIALFTGMRLNEILQLHLSDIRDDKGTWCIYVERSPDDADFAVSKRVKSAAGKRCVPIHPELIRIGLLDRVNAMQRANEVRLFPDAAKSGDGYYSSPTSKWFGRFLERYIEKTPRKVFHSFRHTFRDAIADAELPHDATVALGGWSFSTGAQDERYFHSIKPEKLASYIDRIRYEGLDLSHLYVTK